MKYLLVLALVALVFFFFWQAKRRANLSKPQAQPTSRKQTRLKTTDMVECAVCRVHLPRNEAVSVQQLSYCSEEHRLAAEVAAKRNKPGRGP